MIFETFAWRKQKQSRNGEPEIYTYDDAPLHLRHQICLVMSDGIGNFHEPNPYHYRNVPNANLWWDTIHQICRKEIFSYLSYAERWDLKKRFLEYLLNVQDMDDFLSGVEIGCRVLDALRDKQIEVRGAQQAAGESIEELNGRFEQHAVGYQFENGYIIRVDSKVTHAEIIKPALKLLTSPLFSKANTDFMTAHRHYRANEFKDCVTAAHRAFESMLKAICDIEKWEYGGGDRASDLVTKVSSKGLFTHDFDKSFTAYVAMLKSGLPAIRNDAGAHGEGLMAAAVTAEIARFALNLTASNMLFLGGSYDALKRNEGKAGR